MGLPMRSSGFPDAEVDGARDDSWRHRRFAQLYLTAKPFHVGLNVDGLAFPLHRHTVCGRQTRGQSFLSDAALSHNTVVDSDAFLEGAKPSGMDT
jgi:hypothetical protein